jgi:osmoprotectant transport system substrate-binding protein
MRAYLKRGTALVAVLIAISLLSACWMRGSEPSESTSAKASKKGPITVGSRLGGEGALLGQMILQVLKAHGFTVVDKTRTGSAEEVREALVSKEIDVYPEYTADALLTFHDDVEVSSSVAQSATLIYEKAKSEDAKDGITWLYEAPADSRLGVAVSKEFAEANKLESMEDLARHINADGAFAIAGSKEFFANASAFPAFEEAYGFVAKQDQKVPVGIGDTASPEKTAADGTNDVNASMAHGTDGLLQSLELVMLADPKNAQLPNRPAPVFRTAVVEKYPEVRVWLSPVFVRLDQATLQSLNKQISVDGKDPEVVAAEWLESMGFAH